LTRFAYERAERGSDAQAGVLAAAEDPRVAPVLERLTATRLAFLTRLYTDLGLASEVARRHARLAYSVYLGIADLPRRTRKKSDSGAVASVLWPPRRPAPPGHGSGHGDWRDRSVLPTVPRRDTYRGAKDILTAMSLAVRPQHPEAREMLDQLQAALSVV